MAKIMIVDDDEGFGASLKGRLEQPGLEIVFHRGGFGCLNAIRKSACDLVVLSTDMLGMPARQLTQLIRTTAGIERTRVLLSGTESEDALSKAVTDAGADGYITKDAGALDVALRVKTMLALAPESMRTPPRSLPKEPREAREVRDARDAVTIASSAAAQRRRISSPSIQQVRPEPSSRAPSSPPSASDPTTGVTPQRRSWGRLRAAMSFVAPPIGSPPTVIGAAIAPLLRDMAGRLLLGALRVHEAVILRGAALEEGSVDLVAALSTLSDPSPTENEPARTSEIARYQAALGSSVVEELRREAFAVGAFLLHAALLRADVSLAVTAELMDECWTKALPGERSPRVAVDRYARSAPGSLSSAVAARIVEIAGGLRKPGAMSTALTRLLNAAEEDASIAAAHAKQAIGA